MTNTLPFAVTTPAFVAKVGLKSHDAEALAQFYQRMVGLKELSRRGASIILGAGTGAGSRELLEIEQSSALKPDEPHSAGLFHTAFLLPERKDLARWVRRAIDQQLPVAGASDHAVSEAVYLNDPDGNGIEIYVDRPHQDWKWNGSQVHMTTEAMDINDLLRELDGDQHLWMDAPENSVIGHVHLRVGDAQQADNWWHQELGFNTVATYGTKAVFMSSGGYHHHIAANTWQSAGAGKRDPDRSGLNFVELHDRRDVKSRVINDPWDNEIRIIKI